MPNTHNETFPRRYSNKYKMLDIQYETPLHKLRIPEHYIMVGMVYVNLGQGRDSWVC